MLFEAIAEAKDLLGMPQSSWTFSGNNGEELLRRRFSHVEARGARGYVALPDRESVLAYLRASIALFEGRDRLPEFEGPLTVRCSPVIFVAET